MSAPNLQLIVNCPENSPAVVLSFLGELDQFTVTRAKQAVVALQGMESRTLILDLSRLEFLDAWGLGLCLSAHRRVAHRKLGLLVVAPEGQIRRILGLTRLDLCFPIADTLPQALALLPASAGKAPPDDALSTGH